MQVTSNMPFGRWGEVSGDDVVASVMIDSLVHHAEVLSLAGDSYRAKNRQVLLSATEEESEIRLGLEESIFS